MPPETRQNAFLMPLALFLFLFLFPIGRLSCSMFEDVSNFLFHDTILSADFNAEDPFLIHPLTHSSVVTLQKHSDLLDRNPASINRSGEREHLSPMVMLVQVACLWLSKLGRGLTSRSVGLDG